MPNWNQIVREYLAALRSPPEREIEVDLTLLLYRRLQNPRANTERVACDLRLSAECGLALSHDPEKSEKRNGR